MTRHLRFPGDNGGRGRARSSQPQGYERLQAQAQAQAQDAARPALHRPRDTLSFGDEHAAVLASGSRGTPPTDVRFSHLDSTRLEFSGRYHLGSESEREPGEQKTPRRSASPLTQFIQEAAGPGPSPASQGVHTTGQGQSTTGLSARSRAPMVTAPVRERSVRSSLSNAGASVGSYTRAQTQAQAQVGGVVYVPVASGPAQAAALAHARSQPSSAGSGHFQRSSDAYGQYQTQPNVSTRLRQFGSGRSGRPF